MAGLLILSKERRWWRLWAGVFWFVGISGLIAAYKGLCVILHHKHERMLKPWEDEEEDAEMGDLTHQETATRPASIPDSMHELSTPQKLGDKARTSSAETSLKKRRNWLSPFGQRNSGYGEENWTMREAKRGMRRKIFGRNVWIQDEALRVLQDRIVLGTNLWAALATLLLCVVVVSIPEVGLY